MANAAAVAAGTALLLRDKRWKSEGLLISGAVAVFVPTLTTLYAEQVGGLLDLTVAFAAHSYDRCRSMRAGVALACGA